MEVYIPKCSHTGSDDVKTCTRCSAFTTDFTADFEKVHMSQNWQRNVTLDS